MRGFPQPVVVAGNKFVIIKRVVQLKGRNNKNMVTKGFTLIELIIVIGIIALLATTVILVINPVKIFQEARDSQRLADLGQINSALNLYLATSADATSKGLDNTTATDLCKDDCWMLTGDTAAGCGGRHVKTGTTTNKTTVAGTTQKVDGTGWIPVDLTRVSGGAPLAVYPRDPKKNDASYYYSYACSDQINATTVSTSFEVDANLESGLYSQGGDNDAESTDGGSNDNLLEVGNAPGLAL